MGQTFLKLLFPCQFPTLQLDLADQYIFFFAKISVSSKEFAKWYVSNNGYFHCIENDKSCY